MTAPFFQLAAACSGLSAVALGAFGAHGLRGRLEPYLMEVFQTGVQYQFYHTLALLVLAVMMRHAAHRMLALAGSCFVLGIVLFSGSLYVLALTGIHWLGAVTPLGGVAFLAGWGLLGWHAIMLSRK